MLSISTALLKMEKEEPVVGPISVDDSALVEGCLKKQARSQEALYKKYYGRMLAICVRYLGSEAAHEVLNMGFAKIYSNLEMYGGKGSFEGWMRRTVQNTILDHIKEKSAYKRQVLYDTPEVAIEERVTQRLFEDDLMALLEKLPISSRTVFNMIVIDGFSHEDISKALGITLGTSRWHLNNARKVLKELIEKNY